MIAIENQLISISDLRNVNGIGSKTIERIKKQMEQVELDGQYVSKYDKNLHLDTNRVHLGDCLELMNGIPDKSVDMVLCDLPYGTTACGWDTVIDFNKLWKQYNRIIKDNGAIVLFGSEPFSSNLRMSNIDMYRYDWIWEKSKAGNFMNVKTQPQKIHEDILVFYKDNPTYNPQMEDSVRISSRNKGKRANANILGTSFDKPEYIDNGKRFPYSIQFYSNQSGELNNVHRLHPTQKPVALFEYLIKTYTNEGDLILDNCIGSGTTAISAINTNRNYIGIELDEEYHKIANNRISEI